MTIKQKSLTESLDVDTYQETLVAEVTCVWPINSSNVISTILLSNEESTLQSGISMAPSSQKSLDHRGLSLILQSKPARSFGTDPATICIPLTSTARRICQPTFTSDLPCSALTILMRLLKKECIFKGCLGLFTCPDASGRRYPIESS